MAERERDPETGEEMIRLTPKELDRFRPRDLWSDRPAPVLWTEVEDALEHPPQAHSRAVMPEDVETCPSCGKAMRWIYWRSHPETWKSLAGREGWIAICTDCKQFKPARITFMN